jgi:hypothetical protein
MSSWNLKLYASLIVVVVLTVSLGYAFYGREFSSNLSAERAGIFASITIGFALVDRLIELESRRKWARVCRYTARAIGFHLQEMDFILQTSLSGTALFTEVSRVFVSSPVVGRFTATAAEEHAQ